LYFLVLSEGFHGAIAECTFRVLRRRQVEEINNIPVRGLINRKPEVHVIQEEYSM